jgi:signal transduction histidine kinase/ActR/RegA family two-component response regulator
MADRFSARILKSRWLPLLGLPLLGIGLSALLAQTALYQRVAYWAHDATQQWLGHPLDLSGVAVFDVDEESMTRLAPQLGPWPYERDIYALVTRYLLASDARAVVFDVLFSEARRGDDDFARELSPRAVIAGAALPFPFERSAAYRRQLEAVSLSESTPLASRLWSDLTLPLEMLTRGGARVGVISVQPDEDGVLRRVALVHRAYERRLPALSLAALLAAEPEAALSGAPGRISLGGRHWPVNENGEAAIRFPSNARQLQVQPFYKLALAAAGAPGYEALRETVRDKVVFVGSSSAVLGDFAYTPLGRMPGLYLNAYAHAALAQGAVLRPGGALLDAILFVLFMLPAVVLRARLARLQPRQLVAGATLLALMAAACAAALGLAGIDTAWLAALLAGALTLLLASFEWLARLYRERQRLEFSRRAALEAARLKTEFLNYMTHELRTPIASIKGFNRVNQDNIGADARMKNAAIIARACDHLLALVNNNLDIAKMDAGQMVIDARAEDMRAFAGEVVATMQPQAHDRALALELEMRESVPPVLAIDAFRLKQILLNLISNAIKYTPSGKVTLNVAWEQGRLDIEVRDTGPGMDEATLKQIFEPFRQDGSAASSRSGTGLGLAITRRLAHLMGGEIEARATPGQGSCFSVQIRAPLAELPKPDPARTGHASAAPQKLAGHVLLADDDEDLRGLLEMHLAALGLEVTTAVNGHDAVEAILARPYSCIIMDMQMPVLDGYSAASAMRAGGYSGGILGLTANDAPELLARARAAGCSQVLTKPVTRTQLREALAPLLAMAAAQAATDKESNADE